MRPDTNERDDLIYADFMNNVTVSYLAKKNKVSVARIRQIITKYRNDPKLADRAFDTSHKDEEETVRSFNRNKKEKAKFTTITIEGFGGLQLKARPEDIIQVLKDKFSTNLDKLQELINTGKIDEDTAKMVLKFLDNLKPLQEINDKQDTSTDRMKGVSFGGT
jgi:cysteinyl-tRNA synthetase